MASNSAVRAVTLLGIIFRLTCESEPPGVQLTADPTAARSCSTVVCSSVNRPLDAPCPTTHGGGERARLDPMNGCRRVHDKVQVDFRQESGRHLVNQALRNRPSLAVPGSCQVVGESAISEDDGFVACRRLVKIERGVPNLHGRKAGETHSWPEQRQRARGHRAGQAVSAHRPARRRTRTRPKGIPVRANLDPPPRRCALAHRERLWRTVSANSNRARSCRCWSRAPDPVERAAFDGAQCQRACPTATSRYRLPIARTRGICFHSATRP